MSENPPSIPPPEGPGEEHDPPELDVANVPNALGPQDETVNGLSTRPEHATTGRIRRIAKSVGNWASTGFMRAYELQYGNTPQTNISPEEAPSSAMGETTNEKGKPKVTEPERSRQAILKDEKTLVTIGPSMGMHGGRQFYYIPELGRSVPSNELIFGKFESEEPLGESQDNEVAGSDERLPEKATTFSEEPVEPSESTNESETRRATPNIPVEPVQGLNPVAIEKARESGLPDPESFLSKVLRSSDGSAQRRWEAIFGVPLIVEAEKTSRLSPEQVEIRTKLGHKRGELRAMHEKDILDKPSKVKRTLKRPGGQLPGVRNLRQRQLAKRIYKAKRAEEESADKVRDYGWFDRGTYKKRKVLESVRKIDKDILLDRAKLSRARRHELKDLELDRTKLAGRVVTHHETITALKHRRLNPNDLESHQLYPDLEDDHRAS